MRMTNDEFQAEVFRRAAAYQQRQRTRVIRLRRTALAMGCLVIALTGLAVYPKFSAKNEMNASESRVSNAEYDAVQEAAAEDASEEAAESCAESEAVSEAAMEAESEAAESEMDKSDMLQTTMRSSSEQNSETLQGNGFFYAKTEAEMLQWYGITSLPDTLAGLPLLTDRSDAWYSSAPQLGVITDPDDPELVQSDLSIWIYSSESSPDNSADYSSRRIYIYLQTAQDGSSDEINCEEMHDYTGSIADFSVRGLSVYMEGKYFSTEEMKAAAEELRQALA